MEGIPRRNIRYLPNMFELEDPRREFHFDTTDASGKPVKVYRFSKAASVIKECEDSLKD
jgi:hypothetical protein